ncbi:MAG: DeoR/GlpR family DNA-binding transcription regulator [Eubacteriales bacterium]|nr:DeoR/GlpR family DNA-binding transcription regulator [Eubacteriales bacterium]
MLAEERQNMIVSMVNRNGSVLVKELSAQFEVTEDSIRKDLTLLQKKGLLRKTYGGAVRVRVNEQEWYVSQRKGKNLEDKQAIARKALGMINERDVLFLDISTANLELARLLAESGMRVTVVTNMIDVMLTFAGGSGVKLIFVGGTFSEGKDGFVGALTNQEIRKFRFDKAFMGVVGVDLEGNAVTTYTAEDAATKKAILECASKAYMMLETRKLSMVGNYVYAQVDDFSGAILEKGVDSMAQKQMKAYAAEWII